MNAAESFHPPEKNCLLCPRLASFRDENSQLYPHFYNGAVPSFGDLSAKVLVVGLAPGLKGANQTGRPFTGDFAGDVLYAALKAASLAEGDYARHAADGFRLREVRITNAVRCVPPQNKPLPQEIASCNGFLRSEMAAMPNLQHILSLGRVSHEAVLKAAGLKPAAYVFGHGRQHEVRVGNRTLTLWDSYHTSRYNVQTKRLSQESFNALVKSIQLKIEN